MLRGTNLCSVILQWRFLSQLSMSLLRRRNPSQVHLLWETLLMDLLWSKIRVSQHSLVAEYISPSIRPLCIRPLCIRPLRFLKVRLLLHLPDIPHRVRVAFHHGRLCRRLIQQFYREQLLLHLFFPRATLSKGSPFPLFKKREKRLVYESAVLLPKVNSGIRLKPSSSAKFRHCLAESAPVMPTPLFNSCKIRKQFMFM